MPLGNGVPSGGGSTLMGPLESAITPSVAFEAVVYTHAHFRRYASDASCAEEEASFIGRLQSPRHKKS